MSWNSWAVFREHCSYCLRAGCWIPSPIDEFSLLIEFVGLFAARGPTMGRAADGRLFYSWILARSAVLPPPPSLLFPLGLSILMIRTRRSPGRPLLLSIAAGFRCESRR